MYSPLQDALKRWNATLIDDPFTASGLLAGATPREGLWVPSEDAFFFGTSNDTLASTRQTGIPSILTKYLRPLPVRGLSGLISYLAAGLATAPGTSPAFTSSLVGVPPTFTALPSVANGAEVTSCVQASPGRDVYLAGTNGGAKFLWRVPITTYPAGLVVVTTTLTGVTGTLLSYWVNRWTGFHYAVVVDGGTATVYGSTDAGATFISLGLTWAHNAVAGQFFRFFSIPGMVGLITGTNIYLFTVTAGTWTTLARANGSVGNETSVIQVQDYLIVASQISGPSSLRIVVHRLSAAGAGTAIVVYKTLLYSRVMAGTTLTGPCPTLVTDGGRLYCFEHNPHVSGSVQTQRVMWTSDAWGPAVTDNARAV